MIKADRLNRERFDRIEKERKLKEKNPYAELPPVLPPPRQAVQGQPNLKYFLVWAGSNKFCNNFLSKTAVSDKDRGNAIMTYVKYQVGINPGEQIWVHPDTNSLKYGDDVQQQTIFKKLSDIARKYS